MRMLFLMISLALIALGITACAGGVQVVAATSDSVMLKHSADASGQAAREAENQCSSFAKKARLRSTHDDPGGAGPRQSIYDCVPR
jgi:hypothetical protein